MRRFSSIAAVAACAACLLVLSSSAAAATPTVSISPLGTYASGTFFNGDVGSAEIPAHDPQTQRVFVVNAIANAIDVLDISDPSAPATLGSIELDGRPNSVAVDHGLLAVAVEADPKTDPGTVVLYDASCDPAPAGDCEPLNTIDAGALPDMLTFSPSGRYLLIANEGEPGTVDPKGTITVIDLRKGADDPIVDTVDFTSIDGSPVPAGVILQAGKLPSVDFEPEFITVSKDSKTAWVTLQEANAIAEVDVADADLVAVRGLGFKDHGAAGNAIDASDRDNAINICTWPNLQGMYQPDAIASYQVANHYYLVTANEGDSRAADESRVGDLPAASFDSTFSSTLRNARNLGRLTVNRNLGVDGGIYRKLYVYGARSLSIWSDTGELAFDSGDQLERIVASFPSGAPSPLALTGPIVPAAPAATCPLPTAPALPAAPPLTTPFNSNHEAGPSFDNRSDNKGPEPEGVTLGKIRDRTYAFVGLERVGGVVVYDISDPDAPEFVQYLNRRNFAAVYSVPGTPGAWASAGDLGPEGLAFIPAGDSPTASPLLVVAHEVSGTTTIFSID